MSIAELSQDNDYELYIQKLHCTDIDNLRTAAYPFDFNTDLRIGQQLTGSIFIGKPAIGPNPQTPVYINGEIFNPVVATGYSAVAPIVAVDANGILIDNSLGEIKLEIADATHAGIVTEVAQTFAGDKTFNDNIIASKNIEMVNTSDASHGVITKNGIPFIHNKGTNNFFAGANAGNMTLNGIENVCIGQDVCNGLTNGSFNVVLGQSAGSQMTSANYITIVGYHAGDNITTVNDGCFFGAFAGVGCQGINNCAFGKTSQAVGSLGTANCSFGTNSLYNNQGSSNSSYGRNSGMANNTGNSNLCLGESCGNVGPTTGSNCILLANSGTIADNNLIRIGTVGTQTANYQAGIYGQTGNTSSLPCFVDNQGKLSTQAIKPQQIFYNSNTNITALNYLLLGNGQTNTESKAQFICTKSGTLGNLKALLTVAPGIGNSRTFTLQKNGIPTAEILTINGTNLTGTYIGTGITVAENDLISIRLTDVSAVNSIGIVTLELY